jgi:hypothetical protein
VLALLDAARPEQRNPNLLLAAVHDLLLAGADHPLAARYATVVEARGGDGEEVARRVAQDRNGDPWPDFADFCRTRRDALAAILADSATQTNEVGRCTALLPALAEVARAHGPLALVDLGTSAGLNLHLESYAYRYRPADGGPVLPAGAARSPVVLDCALRATDPPRATPPITWRAGVDQRPRDPADPAAARWLLACQWPDDLARFRRARAALALAARADHRPELLAGDLVDLLPAVASRAPAGVRLCLVHTWVAAYLPEHRQAELVATVARLSAERPVSWIWAELPVMVPGLPSAPAPGTEDRRATALVLVEADRGRLEARRLADLHPHGAWLRWF